MPRVRLNWDAMAYALDDAFPRLAGALPRLSLADLPTPLVSRTIDIDGRRCTVAIKCDDQSNAIYGGNKVRKLEYLLHQAQEKNASRIATFGTVASNHALATAVHARRQHFDCTCLLSHQHRTRKAAETLNAHLANGTEIVRFGGARPSRVSTMRRYLQGRRCWVIPMGGSNWLGTVGFVNAALELLQQTDRVPDRVYIANGTMASAAGLAIGFALADAKTRVQAVRVTLPFVANETAMDRLIQKTVRMMRRYDRSVPADLAERVQLDFREDYLGDGYARTNALTDQAIDRARSELGLQLEATYTGKAMAALLDDLADPRIAEQSLVFWNTFSSAPRDARTTRPADAALPEEFLRYFDD